MRVMTILTAIWIAAVGVYLLAGNLVLHMPSGSHGADLAVAMFWTEFVTWCTAIAGLPMVAIGWPVAIVVRLTRRRKSPVVKVETFPTVPGWYERDNRTGQYRKVDPPC